MPPATNYPWGRNQNIPWRQFVSAPTGWTGDIRLEPGRSAASLVIDIPWSQFLQFVPLAIGYPLAKAGTLNRNLPLFHPMFGYMWCTGIASVQGIKWTSPGTVLNAKGNPIQDGALAAGATNSAMLGSDATGVPLSAYDTARLTLQFEIPNYSIIDDSAKLDEYKRFTVLNQKTTAEYIQRQSSDFSWDAAAPLGGQALLAPRGQLLVKKRYAFKWMMVPELGLLDSSFNPANFDLQLGCVNAATFFNKPAGTLLMDSYDLEPVMMPMSPLTLGLPQGYPPRVWNATINVIYFDPTKGAPSGSVPILGHNLMPASDGKWYPITMTGGKYQYPFGALNANSLLVSFETLFKMLMGQ